jgi:hypothetical protein
MNFYIDRDFITSMDWKCHWNIFCAQNFPYFEFLFSLLILYRVFAESPSLDES